MTDDLSLTRVRAIAPADFRRWVLGGISVTVIGYAVISAVGVWQFGVGTYYAPRLLIVAGICLAAWFMAYAGREIAGSVIAIMATWVEVQTGFLTNPLFPSPGLLVLPVLIFAIGLLLGSRRTFVIAALTVVVTVVMHRLSPAMRANGFDGNSLYWFTLHAISVFAAWAILTLSLSSFDRIFTEMHAKEQDLADTIRFAPDGILVLDGANQILLANPAAEAILQLSSTRIVGRPIVTVLAEVAGTSESVALAPRDTGESPVALEFRAADGSAVHVEATWRRMEHDRRQLLLRNVTERVRAEEQRRAIELQLAHARRLEAVGQLAGGLSHDFNNILTAVSGSAELLRDESNPVERMALLDEIVAARDRGTALTRQLLSFARREVVQARVVDLAAHVSAMQRLLQRVAGDRQMVRFELEKNCTVRVDVGQLEQALVNLVSNARDAMPDGGHCTIRVEKVDDAHRDADGAARVRLHVIDDGVGMSDGVAARAFEPFFTTKARGRGTGLGLASVHAMATQSGGSAHIVSRMGHGTQLMIELPYVAEPASLDPAPSTSPPEFTEPRTILLAEDDEGTRNIVERLLRQAGYVVSAAVDGAEALRIVESGILHIDLLLTDVMMPGLTGPALAERVRALLPDVPVLFMTGYAPEATADFRELAVASVIAKPFSGDVLRSRVAEMLRVRETQTDRL